MASKSVGVSSGTDVDAQAARRRNVPSSSPSNELPGRVELDAKKTQVKKVSAVVVVHLRSVQKAC